MEIEGYLPSESGNITRRIPKQRDPRTSLAFKQSYLGLAAFMFAAGGITLGGGYFVEQECASTSQNWLKYFLYIFVGFFAIWLILTICMMYFYNWTWMTTGFRNQRYGPDMEDIDPGHYGRAGLKLYTDAADATNSMEIHADKGYEQMGIAI